MTGRTLIVVAGMHRSGTSLLAQLLHGLGGFLGEDLDRQSSPSNQGGHWEHSVAWRVEERLLDDLGHVQYFIDRALKRLMVAFGAPARVQSAPVN